MSNQANPEKSAVTPQDDRRSFLKQAGLMTLGVLAATSLMETASASPAHNDAKPVPGKASSTQADIGILNVALALEHQAIAAYQIGAESGLLGSTVLAVAVKFQTQHKAHASVLIETIGKLGGKAVMAKQANEYGFPVELLKNQTDVLHFAAGLEKGAASAYLGAVPAFHNRELAKAAASILGDETMHWAILLNALGEDPVPDAFIA